MGEHVASEEDNGKRLDAFALTLIPDVSRSFVQKLIEEQKILVDGNSQKTGFKIHTGDTVSIDFDMEELKAVPEIDIPIIYEDDDCIVLNKPLGLLTHSKGAYNPEATVATFIAPKLKDMSGDRAGIVHRLDRATSGVIICAKTPEALSWLQKQFSTRKTKKTYAAVIKGEIEPDKAIIDMPIERDPEHPKQFRVGNNGKTAQTAYTVLKTNHAYSLLELKPVTGRTHQLRVHLLQLKHPIVGDALYGGAPHKRLLLHAQDLEITLPNRERKTFSAPLPTEFNDIVK